MHCGVFVFFCEEKCTLFCTSRDGNLYDYFKKKIVDVLKIGHDIKSSDFPPLIHPIFSQNCARMLHVVG